MPWLPENWRFAGQGRENVLVGCDCARGILTYVIMVAFTLAGSLRSGRACIRDACSRSFARSVLYDDVQDCRISTPGAVEKLK
jgi:hypothetical protein